MAFNKSAFSPKSAGFDILEKTLEDPCATPIFLPLDFLRAITDNFSKDQVLGSGGFGVVYKGVLQNGILIAVKKLSDAHIDNDQFDREVTYLIGLRHENIVKLMGYCSESRSQVVQQVSGKYVMAETRDRLICFEYLTNKSLDNYVSDESSGLEWHLRYEIIKGICCGLHYLHNDCRIVHLDLKPANILLDEDMVPKIADFGMSKLFGQQQSRIITASCGGTFGYMAPEYIHNGLITNKSDIFSLGVIIIELLIGSREYPQSTEATFRHFIENVVNRWRIRLEKSSKYMRTLDFYCDQVTACIKIGMKCVNRDPNKRPAAGNVIKMLNAAESKNRFMCRLSYGVASSPGRRASMEDFSEAGIGDVDEEKVGMFGVYDGHGGIRAAEYVKENLFSNLIKHPKFITDTKAAIVEAYNHIDSEFLKSDIRQIRNAGSTATTALVIGDRLFVANVGDSRAVICKGGDAIQVSRDHKPDSSDERERIENAGGFVMWAGKWLVGGFVDVSRAFGYKLLKQYVVADPEIKEEVVDRSLEFLILATDGLWDVVTNEEAVAMAKSFEDPQEAADKLLQEAAKRGSSGNITVLIVRFQDGTTVEE